MCESALDLPTDIFQRCRHDLRSSLSATGEPKEQRRIPDPRQIVPTGGQKCLHHRSRSRNGRPTLVIRRPPSIGPAHGRKQLSHSGDYRFGVFT